jgi:hypothetical protein
MRSLAQHIVRRSASVPRWAWALVLISACAYGTRAGNERQVSESQDVISRADLDRIVASTAFEAVERLRPRWLQPRGPTSVLEPQGTLPTVYVDGRPAGDLTALNAIPTEEISELHYVSPTDATTRWGTGVSGGVIEVITARRRP